MIFAAYGEMSIREGAKGGDVVTLQKLLVTVGLKLSIDGQFGSATKSAVKQFQAASGLAQDGIVGPNTWAALKQAAALVPPSASAPLVLGATTPQGAAAAAQPTTSPQVTTAPAGQVDPATGLVVEQEGFPAFVKKHGSKVALGLGAILVLAMLAGGSKKSAPAPAMAGYRRRRRARR